MSHRDVLRSAITASRLVTGWAVPSVVLQHALEDLEKPPIDIAHLQRKRDRLVGALRRFGYEVRAPEGTFYLMVRSL